MTNLVITNETLIRAQIRINEYSDGIATSSARIDSDFVLLSSNVSLETDDIEELKEIAFESFYDEQTSTLTCYFQNGDFEKAGLQKFDDSFLS